MSYAGNEGPDEPVHLQSEQGIQYTVTESVDIIENIDRSLSSSSVSFLGLCRSAG